MNFHRNRKFSKLGMESRYDTMDYGLGGRRVRNLKFMAKAVTPHQQQTRRRAEHCIMEAVSGQLVKIHRLPAENIKSIRPRSKGDNKICF